METKELAEKIKALNQTEILNLNAHLSGEYQVLPYSQVLAYQSTAPPDGIAIVLPAVADATAQSSADGDPLSPDSSHPKPPKP